MQSAFVPFIFLLQIKQSLVVVKGVSETWLSWDEKNCNTLF